MSNYHFLCTHPLYFTFLKIVNVFGRNMQEYTYMHFVGTTTTSSSNVKMLNVKINKICTDKSCHEKTAYASDCAF
jgi:hypothetical protein